MIQLRNISLSFGSQTVFDDISLNVAADQRVGLVGRNGSGKSTLLKVITHPNTLDSGSVVISGGFSIAYMPQEVVLKSTKSIENEVIDSCKGFGKIKERLATLEQLVQAHDGAAVEEYGALLQQLKELEYDATVAKAHKILIGLGFKKEQLQESVQTLSVGWQMRVVLSQLLLQEADFYFFDEPTNHLDIVAKEWFLEFLRESSAGFMLVCHDKYFLDMICTSIIALEHGKAKEYYGNYAHYIVEREEELEQLKADYVQQQKELKRKQEVIDRFKAKASKATMAKSMEKALDKIELITLPPETRKVRFSFTPPVRPGKEVLRVENVSYAYDKKQIFKNITFTIERDQKVALIAPNGMGKTTLFNVVSGKYKPQSGSVNLGYNVKMTLFEQEQHKILDPKKTILQEIFYHVTHKTEQQIRTFLGSFLFSRDQVDKKTGVLSGGERNRVSMVKVLLQDANLLLLDEPTNHLDIESKDVLLTALKQFEGTIFFVSHDQDFVNELATHILELTPEGVFKYEGNYDSFLQQKALQDELRTQEPKKKDEERQERTVSIEKKVTISENAKKERQNVERLITKLESEIKALHKKFEDLDFGTSEFTQAQNKLQEKEEALKKAEEEWALLD